MSVIYSVGLSGELSLYIPFVVPGIGVCIPDNSISLPEELAKPEKGFVWVLVGNKPELLVDHRGVVYSTVTGDEQEYKELGALPEGLTINPKPSAIHVWTNGSWQVDRTLSQELVWRQIKSERDRRKALGVKVGSNWFHSDDSSRIQQLALVIMGQNMPVGIQWKTMSDEFVLMTPTLAGQIFTATATLDQLLFSNATTHRTAMLAAAVPSEYNFSTGWPAFYQE